MPKHVMVMVDGMMYPNMMQAWRAESPIGLNYNTVLERLRAGWGHDMAFLAIPGTNSRYARALATLQESE